MYTSSTIPHVRNNNNEIRRHTPRKFNLTMYDIISDDMPLLQEVVGLGYMPSSEEELEQTFFDIKTIETKTNQETIREYRVLIVYPPRIQSLNMNAINRITFANPLKINDVEFGVCMRFCTAYGFSPLESYQGKCAMVVHVRSFKSPNKVLTEEIMLTILSSESNTRRRVVLDERTDDEEEGTNGVEEENEDTDVKMQSPRSNGSKKMERKSSLRNILPSWMGGSSRKEETAKEEDERDNKRRKTIGSQ